MNAELQVVDASRMTEEDIRAVAEITWQAWPSPDSSVERYAQDMMTRIANDVGVGARVRRLALVRVAGRPVATATTFAREIRSAEGPKVIVALAGVACLESYRGRGFGREVVEASFQRVRDGAFDCCLFQTTSNVRPFYEALGCAAVNNPAVNSLNRDDPEAWPWWDPEVLIYPGGSPHWPSGTIDLCGPAW